MLIFETVLIIENLRYINSAYMIICVISCSFSFIFSQSAASLQLLMIRLDISSSGSHQKTVGDTMKKESIDFLYGPIRDKRFPSGFFPIFLQISFIFSDPRKYFCQHKISFLALCRKKSSLSSLKIWKH